MTSNWDRQPFKAVLAESVRNGIYKQKSFHGHGVKIVNMGELFAHPRLTAIEMRRLEVSPSELERFALVPGDLLFARRSVVAEGAGKCCLVLEVDDDTVFESSIIRARPDPLKADSRFLFYFFSSDLGRHLLQTIRRQVAVSGITGRDLEMLEIPLPGIKEQRRIGAVLSALDDKIEHSGILRGRLASLRRVIFNKYSSHRAPVPLGNLVELSRERVGSRTDVVVLSAVNSGALVESAQQFNKRVHSTDISRYLLVPRWSFAYNPSRINIGSIGLHREPWDGAVSPVYVVARTAARWASWIEHCLRTDEVRRAIVRLSSGSVRQSLSFANFASIEVPSLSEQDLASFSAQDEPLRRFLEYLEVGADTVRSTRDTLLHKVVSGAIRVPESYDPDGVLGTVADAARVAVP